MEHMQEVRLKPSNTFELEDTEIERLYLSLSLHQYQYLRNPYYNKQHFLELLKKDFKKFYSESQRLHEKDPNNLILSRIMLFFDTHYKKLKDLCEQKDKN